MLIMVNKLQRNVLTIFEHSWCCFFIVTLQRFIMNEYHKYIKK